MNRKKVLMLVVVVAALGGSAVMLLWPEKKGPRLDLQRSDAAEAAYGRGEYEEANKLFQQVLEVTTDSDVSARARYLSSVSQGHTAVANIRKLVFQDEKYGQALPVLQEAMRQYGSDRDLSAELARLRITVVVADFLERTDKKYSTPITLVDEDELRQARDELTTAVERHRENKENGYLEGLRTLDAARDRLSARLKEANTRLTSLLAVKNDWEDAVASRNAKQWKEEAESLEEMLTHPEDLVLSVTKGRDAESLLDNAKEFLAAVNAYNVEKFDEARERFSKVEREDYHYAAARDYIQEIASNAEYYKSMKMYREGRPGEAVNTLSRIRMEDPKFGALYDLAIDRQERIENLETLQKNREWAGLRDKSQEFKGLLEKPRDSFYAQVVERNIELARQRIYESERQALWQERKTAYDDLEWNFSIKNYSKVITGSRELLSMVLAERFNDLVREVDALLTKTEDIVLAESKAWLPVGMSKLKEYLADPLDENDRKGEITPDVRKKISLLSDLYINSFNALMGARQLPPERVAEVEQISKYVMDEVMHQQEILFNIRDTYERLGNLKGMKTAESKIILLPEIEGSNWRKRIRTQTPESIDLSSK